MVYLCSFFFFFFFNDTATTEIYTLSLHDALPISRDWSPPARTVPCRCGCRTARDRKSTRLNSSHDQISYAVFCLKKKKKLNSLRGRQGQVAAGNFELCVCALRPAPSAFGIFTAVVFFFFNDTATTEIYTLSLHDALPI